MKKNDYIQNQESNIKKPIFVIGMPRSGTTVVSETISAHEKLGWFSNYFKWFPSVPEITFLSRILDFPHIGQYLRGKKTQNSDLISFIRMLLPFCSEAYTVWNRYCVEYFDKDYLIKHSAGQEEKEKITSLIKKVLRFQGKDRFFSKLTGPPRIKYLSSIFPDACFINVIRDPRANISSILRVPFWEQNDGYSKPWWENGLSNESIYEWTKYGRTPVALCAVQWKEILEITWQEKKLIDSERYVEIRYEEFVKNSYDVLTNAFNLFDLPLSHNVFSYVNSIGKVYDMNYKYHNNLKSCEIDIINKITSITAGKAGYDI
jgi:omega-hydroxy-beta-dihydromenaquinone-9 sulfotransferase